MKPFSTSRLWLIALPKLVVLTGGAQARNIYWQVNGQATLGPTAVTLDANRIVVSE